MRTCTHQLSSLVTVVPPTEVGLEEWSKLGGPPLLAMPPSYLSESQKQRFVHGALGEWWRGDGRAVVGSVVFLLTGPSSACLMLTAALGIVKTLDPGNTALFEEVKNYVKKHCLPFENRSRKRPAEVGTEGWAICLAAA